MPNFDDVIYRVVREAPFAVSFGFVFTQLRDHSGFIITDDAVGDFFEHVYQGLKRLVAARLIQEHEVISNSTGSYHLAYRIPARKEGRPS
jgi:hypothetical protein